MVVTFTEERKKQKKLIYILGAVILVTLIVLWFGFLGKPRKEEAGGVLPSVELRKAEINFNFLESSTLKELQSFTKIPPFGGKTGRENPFLPY